MRHLPLIPLLALTYLAQAADGQPTTHHLRLEVQSLPTGIDVESRAAGGSASQSVDADSAGRLGLGYWHAWHPEDGGDASFLLGGGLDLSSFSFSSNNVKSTITQTGLFVEPALGYRLVPWFSLEAALRGGFGQVKTTSDAPGTNIGDTTYAEASLRLRGVFTLKPGLELFADVGYLHQQFSYKYRVLNIDVTQDLTVAGGFAGLGVGWGF